MSIRPNVQLGLAILTLLFMLALFGAATAGYTLGYRDGIHWTSSVCR